MTRSKILLLGKNGQVGWELNRTLKLLGDVVALGRAELNLTDIGRIREVVREVRPGLIVNAAAYTAVDQAESEPELAMAVNGTAPGVLAEEAQRIGGALLHYSTDYVFDGQKGSPYAETDRPNPINVYGESKLAGERAIQHVGGAYLILRTSWVYGGRGENFFLTILRLAREREVIRVVDDQGGSPTWCGAIAEATTQVLARLRSTDGWDTAAFGDLSGIYHYAAAGQTSWYGFASAILETDPGREAHRTRKIAPISTAEYPTAAARPAYAVLSTEKLASRFQIKPDDWREQLNACWATVNLTGVGG